MRKRVLFSRSFQNRVVVWDAEPLLFSSIVLCLPQFSFLLSFFFFYLRRSICTGRFGFFNAAPTSLTPISSTPVPSTFFICSVNRTTNGQVRWDRQLRKMETAFHVSSTLAVYKFPKFLLNLIAATTISVTVVLSVHIPCILGVTAAWKEISIGINSALHRFCARTNVPTTRFKRFDHLSALGQYAIESA